MKSTKTNTVASFGAAMATLYAAPELCADIVAITLNPGMVANGSVTLANITVADPSGGTPLFAGQVLAQNNNISDIISNAFGMESMFMVTEEETIQPFYNGGSPILYFFGETGPQFIGFNHLPTGNVGWFSLDLGQPGDTMILTGGQYGTNGETLQAGVFLSNVPEPSTTTGLALLALGAAGVRRRKKDCHAQSAA